MTLEQLTHAVEAGDSAPFHGQSREFYAALRPILAELPVESRVWVLNACGDNAEAIELLLDNTLESGMFTAISRSALAESRVEEVTAILDESGLVPWPEVHADQVRWLASALARYRMWKWTLGVVFSREVLISLPAVVADRDAAVRLAAVLNLASFVPDDQRVKDALVGALHDSARAVRNAAVESSKAQLEPDEFDAILAAEEEGLRDIGARASEAQRLLHPWLWRFRVLAR